MVIDGSTYTKDVIIFPDGDILCPWWRKQGHVLAIDDLAPLLAAEPETIICGSGAMGVMRPSANLKKHLAESAVEFVIQRSPEAVATYNQVSSTKRVGGCFHLTC
jgi:hypothetical protein